MQKYKFTIFIIIGLLITGFTGYFIGRHNSSDIKLTMTATQTPKATSTVTPAATATPVPTEAPTYSADKIKELEDAWVLASRQFNEKSDQLAANEIELAAIKNDLLQLTVLRDKIKKVTEITNFEYDIVSAKFGEPPYETVVYVKNVPEALEEIYILKASLVFSAEKFKKISLWSNLQDARKFVSGDYDPEETNFGWIGLDSKFGSIDNSSKKPRMAQYFSGHDSAMMEFGRYSGE